MSVRAFLLAAFLAATHLSAQSSAGLQVTSNPPGTTVLLEGEYNLAGVTPTVFDQPLTGVYTLRAVRDGYETYRTRVVLTGGTLQKVSIVLSPKTPFKAGLRSAVLPGWGQIYSGEKARGVMFGITALAAGITWLVIDRNFQNKFDDFDARYAEFLAERNVERRKELLPFLNLAREKAYDAENWRRGATIAAAIVWAYNLVDAVVFFPNRKYEAAGARLSLDPEASRERFGLALNVRF